MAFMFLFTWMAYVKNTMKSSTLHYVKLIHLSHQPYTTKLVNNTVKTFYYQKSKTIKH